MIFGILSVGFAIIGGVFGFLQERHDHQDTIAKASEKASEIVLKKIKK